MIINVSPWNPYDAAGVEASAVEIIAVHDVDDHAGKEARHISIFTL